jgi:hypothetical protein
MMAWCVCVRACVCNDTTRTCVSHTSKLKVFCDCEKEREIERERERAKEGRTEKERERQRDSDRDTNTDTDTHTHMCVWECVCDTQVRVVSLHPPYIACGTCSTLTKLSKLQH